MRKIFITGGCGFIGANLVKFLLDKGGYDITVYDNLSAGSESNLNNAIRDSGQRGNVNFIKADVLNKQRLHTHIKDHQTVIHLAAHTSVAESLKKPELDFELNCRGTFNLLEAARRGGIKNFIYASSNAALGEQTPPISEDRIPLPKSIYGANKLYGEALCSAYCRSFGINTVSLRFANCYGPYSKHKASVVAKFIKNAMDGNPLDIYGDGNQTRDFIHSEDISNAIYLCIKMPGMAAGEVFQVGTQTQTRIKTLAGIISQTSGKNLRIIYHPQRKGEIKRNYSEIKKIKAALGFYPKIGLRTGLKSLWEWFSQAR